MDKEIAAIVEQDGEWFISYCAEAPGANGQGLTREECIANLKEVITMILDIARPPAEARATLKQVQ